MHSRGAHARKVSRTQFGQSAVCLRAPAYTAVMRLIATWEQGDVFGNHVCLLLSPVDWKELKFAHRGFQRHLTSATVRSLFAQRLQGRLAAAAALEDECNRPMSRGLMPSDGHRDGLPAPEEVAIASWVPMLSVACLTEALAEVLSDATAFPQLMEPNLGPVREAVSRLHRLALRDQQLLPRERSGRRSSLQRRLLRTFAGLNGIVLRLVRLLHVFPSGSMPSDVFVSACEVLSSLIHNSKESKRSFVAVGGLCRVLAFLRDHPHEAEMQAAGLAVLLALSAKSVLCIRTMVDYGVHQVVAQAVLNFPTDANVMMRGTGLLANMSNVPCVCPALQRCGVLNIAQRLAGDGPLSQSAGASRHNRVPEPATPFVRDFGRYLLAKLQEHEVPSGQPRPHHDARSFA